MWTCVLCQSVRPKVVARPTSNMERGKVVLNAHKLNSWAIPIENLERGLMLEQSAVNFFPV